MRRPPARPRHRRCAAGGRPRSAPNSTTTYTGCDTFACVVLRLSVSEPSATPGPSGPVLQYVVGYEGTVQLVQPLPGSVRPNLLSRDLVFAGGLFGGPNRDYEDFRFYQGGAFNADGLAQFLQFPGSYRGLPYAPTGFRYDVFGGGISAQGTVALAAVVPEPTTLALAGAGVVMIGAWARRRRAA
jgi:hypothetical protein